MMDVRVNRTEYKALAETHAVTVDSSGHATLFEESNLNTKGCSELRLFVHVMNEHYQNSPFTNSASLTISAFHGIGRGSWSYFSQTFPMKVTSELHGLVQIPVIGKRTRVVVFGSGLPPVEVETDVAAYLLS